MAPDRPRRGLGKASASSRKAKSRMVAASAPSPHQNHLLNALPVSDYERIAPHLELIAMDLGDAL